MGKTKKINREQIHLYKGLEQKDEKQTNWKECAVVFNDGSIDYSFIAVVPKFSDAEQSDFAGFLQSKGWTLENTTERIYISREGIKIDEIVNCLDFSEVYRIVSQRFKESIPINEFVKTLEDELKALDYHRVKTGTEYRKSESPRSKDISPSHKAVDLLSMNEFETED